ncbi:MAG: thiamine biosynthesis protein ThiC [Pseudomonadota bacterium]
MDYTFKQTVKLVAALLIALAITQSVYTALYVAKAPVPRQLLWGLEGLLFVFLAAFAGAALAESRTLKVGWSAIAFSAVLNVVQVGVGLTMFGPFREASQDLETLAPTAGAVVAFSFFVYNAAKILLGFAALIFGLQKKAVGTGGASMLGTVTALIGVIAIISNATVMALGRGSFIPSPVAGGSGVVATLLLALCLSSTSPTSGE